MKRTVTHMSDPAHGWVSVAIKDIVALGIADDISACSYMSATRVYLEEDCDAAVFSKAAKAAGWEIAYKASHTDAPSSIRSKASYNKHWVYNPIGIGRRIATHDGEEYVIAGERKRHWFVSKSVTGVWLMQVAKSNPYRHIMPPAVLKYRQ